MPFNPALDENFEQLLFKFEQIKNILNNLCSKQKIFWKTCKTKVVRYHQQNAERRPDNYKWPRINLHASYKMTILLSIYLYNVKLHHLEKGYLQSAKSNQYHCQYFQLKLIHKKNRFGIHFLNKSKRTYYKGAKCLRCTLFSSLKVQIRRHFLIKNVIPLFWNKYFMWQWFDLSFSQILLGPSHHHRSDVVSVKKIVFQRS